ncbi:MAG: hypothetical protein HFJ87_07595 [Muribaculaceae bacterium]|nr:hypothetical protein [Muribaculaceae bacterium]
MRKVLLILIAVFSVAVSAQDYRRTIPRPVRQKQVVEPERACDSTANWNDSLAVAGFEKPLRAVRESMFITNKSSVAVEGLELEITYLDMKGRMLHKVTRKITVDLPSGETRRVEVPAFDRQGLFYYKLSPVPARATQATPFDVKVKICKVFLPK